MRLPLSLLLMTVVSLFSCRQINSEKKEAAPSNNAKPGMIKVTILYPAGPGKTFDMKYYSEKHMPLVASLLGDSLKLYSIDKVLMGRTPEDSIPFAAIGYLYFDRLSAYQNSFGPHRDSILKDIPNYTNIQPVVVISEVVK